MAYKHNICALGATFTGRDITAAEAHLNAISAADRFELASELPVVVAESAYKMGQNAYQGFETTDANPFDAVREHGEYSEWLAGFQAEADKDWEDDEY